MAPYATFPNIQVLSADFVFSTGATPSICILTGIPYSVTCTPGPLVIGDGTNYVAFQDCAVERSIGLEEKTYQGPRVTYRVLDRRWRWRGVRVNGEYNMRKPDGTILPSTKKSYYELIGLIATALGEPSFTCDIASLTIDAPHVRWDNADASAELEWLCQHAGCAVTLGLDNLMHVVKRGEGTLYPPNSHERMPSVDQSPTLIPSAVKVTFAPTVYEKLVELEAVGLDTDGTIRPIDSLSYKLTGGWSTWQPGYQALGAGTEGSLANLTVYRWYRPKLGIGFTLPDGSTTQSLDYILPLNDTRAVTAYYSSNEKLPKSSPALVIGVWFDGSLKGENTSTSTSSMRPVTVPFQVDGETGIVKFERPVFQTDTSLNQSSPSLYMLCQFTARSTAEGMGRIAYSKEVSTGLPGALSGYVVPLSESSMSRKVVQGYSTVFQPTTVADNKATLDTHADALAAEYARNFKHYPMATQEWVGIIPYPLAGNLLQMRWVVGSGYAKTYGYKNTDSVFAPSHQVTHKDAMVRRLLCCQ